MKGEKMNIQAYQGKSGFIEDNSWANNWATHHRSYLMESLLDKLEHQIVVEKHKKRHHWVIIMQHGKPNETRCMYCNQLIEKAKKRCKAISVNRKMKK